MAASKPGHRTLQHLKKNGYRAGMVERFVAQAGPHGKRFDLFGFIDIVALREGLIIGIQACAGSSVADRRKKILKERRSEAHDWLSHGGVIEVWGWTKYAKPLPGERCLWRPRIVPITFADLDVDPG